MTRKQKKLLFRIIISGALFISGHFLKNYETASIILFGAAFIITGYDCIFKAIKNIFKGNVFDENFLMSLASIGAIIIGNYSEGVAVLLFYQVGDLFESYAVGKSRKSIAELMDIRPDVANLKKDGEIIEVSPYDVNIDDVIVVRPGEKIPLDGVIVEGNTSVDTSALTGESVPRELAAGDSALSGFINQSGVISIAVKKKFEESTASKILELVENASSKKAKTENFITRFSRYYTPVVVILAVIIAILPPIIFKESFSHWITPALTFLVISCPCALVISVPLGFFSGIGCASKNGVLVKGGNYLEALSRAGVVVFDKTGTLTKGNFEVSEIAPVDISCDELLELASYAEYHSSHPLALSIKKAYGKDIDEEKIALTEEIAGFGIKTVAFGKEILAGNIKLLKQNNIETGILPKNNATTVFIAVDGKYQGYISAEDEIKEEAFGLSEALKKVGVKKTVMLTGDKKEIGEAVSKKLMIDEVKAELLPQDKVSAVEEMLNEKKADGSLCFVGDGMNDAPVLTMADVGVAMGGLGSDSAIEASDIVIMDDNPKKLVFAIKLAKKTLSIVKQNIWFALGIKFSIMLFGVIGFAFGWSFVLNYWMYFAVFADVGVSVIAILNSMRAMRIKE